MKNPENPDLIPKVIHKSKHNRVGKLRIENYEDPDPTPKSVEINSINRIKTGSRKVRKLLSKHPISDFAFRSLSFAFISCSISYNW